MNAPARNLLSALFIGTVATGCTMDMGSPKDTAEVHNRKVTALLREAQTKHMVIVIDGTVSDLDAAAALPSQKIRTTSTMQGDSTAIKAYGPDAKNGVLLLTTQPAGPDTAAKGKTRDTAGGGAKPSNP